MNLLNAQVVGYFSAPSPQLAETNPEAYTRAMAELPDGACSCANCGMGIRHHVVILQPNGRKAFIGSDCAERIGGEIARCVRERCTAEQLFAREARFQKQREEYDNAQAAHNTRFAVRSKYFAVALSVLESDNPFFQSLASQLKAGPLSDKQARYALKAVFGRRNKANAAQFDALWNDMTADEVTA